MMRRSTAIILMIVSLAFPCAAVAGVSSLDVGLGYHYFDYREDLNPPLKSTESGWLPGISVKYAYRMPSFFYTQVYADYAAADLTFDGTTQGGMPVRFTGSPQRFFKLEWNIGYVWQAGHNLQIIPFIGYGYRHWLRGKAGITPTFSTIEEEYSWSYLPAGLKADYTINRRWSIGATAALNIMFNGKMKARLSQVLAGANDPEFDLGSRPGFYAELPMTFRFTNQWALVASPWYEYSQIGQSNTLNVVQNNTLIGFAFEPASRTHQYGFRLGASYSF
jgi:hypothetical protein